MIVAVAKERKILEKRVALTPSSVKVLVDNEIKVLVEENAGLGCNFTNEDYEDAGAKIVSQSMVWDCPLVLKVKEPQPSEYDFFKKNQIVWGFLHLSAYPECVKKMQEMNMTAIASETISKDNVLSLLKPVSIIAGRRSVFTGLSLLENHHGGKGILLPGIDRETAGDVLIFGGGVVGENACDMAVAIGCNVVVIENNDERIRQLKDLYADKNVMVLKYSEVVLASEMRRCDLLISTILIPGSRPPKLVKEYMVKDMQKGSVIVDVAIDQGGCVETFDRPTTHQDPTFIKYGIVHYGVANMPGAVATTATLAIQGVVEYLLSYKNTGALDESGMQINAGVICNENLKNSIENM